MADGSKIEWTEATWNPLVGCTKVSPGCDNCYAEGEVTRRHAAALSTKTSPKMLEAFPAPFDQVSIRPSRFLLQPLSAAWRAPRRIFVNSLSDLFHADVPDEFIAEVFAVMALAGQHTFQLLTKRHARMRSLLNDDGFVSEIAMEIVNLTVVEGYPEHPVEPGIDWWPLRNVWLGVSVEDQKWADIRIPALLATPAAVRWISAEPLLGAVDLTRAIGQFTLGLELDDCLRCTVHSSVHGGVDSHEFVPPLGWVVAGGESGSGARPMHPDWARALRDQCEAADVPFLFKQWGSWRPAGSEAEVTGQPCAYVAIDGHIAGRVIDPATLLMSRMSKAAAGRELDGRTHDGYPDVAVHA